MLAVWKYYKVYEFERLTAENENKKKAEKRLLTQATIESTRAYNRDSKKAKDITGKVGNCVYRAGRPAIQIN